MDWLSLTPTSIPVLMQPLMTGCLVVYFLTLSEKTRATWILTAMFVNATCYMLVNFLLYAAPAPYTAFFANLLQFFALSGMSLLIGFAYAFLGNVHPRESKYFFGSVGVLVALALFSLIGRLLVYGAEVSVPGLPYELLSLTLVLWALGVFIRKARLPGEAGRGHRALAGLFSFLFLAQFTSFLALFGLINAGLHYLIADLSFLFLFCGFAFIYLNHAPHPTSFQVKLVGLSLFTVLTVLSLTSVMAFPEEALMLESGVRLPDQTSLRFEPRAESYQVAAAPYAFDPVLGERLTLAEEGATPIDLGFAFPFFGTPRQRLALSHEAAVTFDEGPGAAVRGRFDEPPLIAPLRVPLRETENGGVYLKRDPDRLTITWREMSQPDLANRNTVQLVLFADGAVVFNYDRVEAVMATGLRGVFPGGPSPSLRPVASSLADGQAGPVLVEDFTARYRRRVHRRMLPVAYGLFGAMGFVLLVFPLFFRRSLVRPMERLLGGMGQVNAGNFDTVVPVGVRDEVGRLTEHFNQMTGSLQKANLKLKDYAEHLEEMVEERTAQIEAQKAQIEAQNAQLAGQAERLRDLDEAKTRFFANISHEFRTPLTLILGPLEQARKEGAALTQDEQALMLRNGRRLQRLINQILDLARLEAGSLVLNSSPRDLVSYTRHHVSLFRALAAYRRIDLAFESATPTCPALIDPDQMEKVIGNLLSNALKFTPEGGRVRVAVAHRGETAEITVADTGPGIAVDKLPHLFDRFFQADDSVTRAYEGSGIGLALVKEVVELHGGTVQVESKPGQGTTFIVHLPLAAEAEQAAAPAPAPPSGNGLAAGAYADVARTEPPPPMGEGRALEDGLPVPDPEPQPVDQATVLVVEDNADMRAFIRSVLEPDFRVLEASDGERGLALAQDALPDLILADVMMPKMDGFAMSRALKDSGETDCIPIIVLTARAGAEDRVEGLATGVDAYLTKPFVAEALRLQVGNLIARQHRLRERLQQEAVPPDLPAPCSAFEAQVRALVEAHLTDPGFSVERLADEAAMSRQHLHRRLTEEVGMTPVQYIRGMRLEQAARLLRERQGNVTEVAYAVGFNSLSHFSACFREHFGTAPSAYAATA